MNIIKKKDKLFKYESVWRDKKEKVVRDYMNKEIPYPVESKQDWNMRILFLEKLKSMQSYLTRADKLIKYKKGQDCLICGQKNVGTMLFAVNKIRWEDSLEHYIKQHRVKPSDEFMDYVFRFKDPLKKNKNEVARFKSNLYVIKGKQYLKLERNQLQMFDALMYHGGIKKKYVD